MDFKIPIYCTFCGLRIPQNAKKVLFVDASDKGNYAAVLGQLQHSNDSPYIPDHLILDDPVDYF